MKFLPERRLISSFGDGGFRFGDHSHRGPLLILPSGMRAWDGADMSGVVAEKSEIDVFLFGAGPRHASLTAANKTLLSANAISFDAMSTPAAIHTYNIMLGEERRVAAGFLPVP